jgi:uncharacterized protein (DUF362 family)
MQGVKANMKSAKSKTGKSVVAITKGERWEAKKVLREGLELIGGINSVFKKGDTVLIKPNMGYPAAPGLPQWTCTTDVMVQVALTELFLEAGAKRVIVGDSTGRRRAAYQFQTSGVQEAVEKAGGEISYFDEEPHVTREIPGGVLLKKQAVPKVVLDADVIINVPKIKPTRVGNKFTLGFKNFFGLIPHEERLPWHRMPEFVYLITDLFKLVKPTLTVMDGFVIQEGFGPRWGDPVSMGVVIMGKDPVATEAVTMLVVGHEVYEQPVLGVAQKYGLGTADIKNIEVRGKSIESVRRYAKVSPADICYHPSPNVVEYVGGACYGCQLWIQYTPHAWEIDKKKKYALVVGALPRLPEKFTEDEIIVLGSCAVRSKGKIAKACPKGVTPQFIGGCPPYWHRQAGYYQGQDIGNLPLPHPTNYVTEGPATKKKKKEQHQCALCGKELPVSMGKCPHCGELVDDKA